MNPFTGIYSASKHAVEAVAETMSLELQEFGIEVATINPGPFLLVSTTVVLRRGRVGKTIHPSDYSTTPS